MRVLETSSERALLLVGHGTRDRAGLDEFHALVRLVAELSPGRIVEHAFLELAEPTIRDGLSRLAARGAKAVQAAPMLLFAAGHARVDIPRALADARAAFPRLDVAMGTCFDADPRIVDLSTLRYEEALAAQRRIPARDTALVFVGRGTRDATARAAFERFAQLRRERSQVGQVATCFAAAAEPRVEATLAAMARAPYPRIVVQPHLLFRGEVWGQVAAAVAAQGALSPDKQWLLSAPLGAHRLLAEAVLATSATWT